MDSNERQLLSPEILTKLVEENIRRLCKCIEDKKFIEVERLWVKNQTTPSIRKFLNEVCEFKDDNYSGLYVFFDQSDMKSQNKGLYTGISRNLVVRLKDHISGGDPSVASFAVLMARKDDNDLNDYLTSTAYISSKTPEEIILKKNWKDKLKGKVRHIQSKEMRRFYLTAIPITNYHELHATEPFVAGAFQCEFNSFKTH